MLISILMLWWCTSTKVEAKTWYSFAMHYVLWDCLYCYLAWWLMHIERERVQFYESTFFFLLRASRALYKDQRRVYKDQLEYCFGSSSSRMQCTWDREEVRIWTKIGGPWDYLRTSLQELPLHPSPSPRQSCLLSTGKGLHCPIAPYWSMSWPAPASR